MKKSFWVVLMVFVLICMGALVLKAEGPKKVPEKFEINSDAKHFTNAKKSKIPPKYKLVSLSHKKHADIYGCMTCHHKLKDDTPDQQKLAKKCSSEGCHTVKAKEKEAKEKEEKEKSIDLKTAMHKQCYKDCHKNDEKATSKNAPIKCNDCHVKTEKAEAK